MKEFNGIIASLTADTDGTIEIEVDDFVVVMNSANRLGWTSCHLPKPLPKIGKAVTA